jgi:cyanophycinase
MQYSGGMARLRILRLSVLLLSLAPAIAAPAQTATNYRYFRLGNAAGASATPRPGYALMGGGSDLDEAFRFLCDRSGGGDFLVLRATGDGDEYNPYIQGLCHVNSVATLVIPSRAAAADPFVSQAIRHASALFISGGDQANYINFWMGTPVEEALNDAIRRGVPLGGTSAGLAVMGEYCYSAQGDKPEDKDLESKSTLANPFHLRVTLVHNFLQIPILKGVITDTHFAKRNRMGRLLVFLARLNEPDGKPLPPTAPRVRGIGVQERAAVLLEPDGRASVVGHGSAYFVDAHHADDVLEKGKPLTFGAFAVQKVEPGYTFDLKTWGGYATGYWLSVEAGKVRSIQPSGAIY